MVFLAWELQNHYRKLLKIWIPGLQLQKFWASVLLLFVSFGLTVFWGGGVLFLVLIFGFGVVVFVFVLGCIGD